MVEGWTKVTIGECCDILDHKRIPINSEEREKIPGYIPYYGANGVLDYINDFIFDKDLILMAEDGGYFDEFATRPIAYRISGKSWVNNHAHILRAKKGYCQDFIFYSIVHKNILTFIKGGTRSKLNQAELRSIEINIPISYEEQLKISSILNKVDEAIGQTEKTIYKQEKIKTGLMQDLFNKGIDEDGNIRNEEKHKFKDSPFGRIPEEWKVKTLLAALNNNSSLIVAGPFGSNLKVSDYKEEGIPIIRLQNIERNEFIFKDIKYISKEKAKSLNYHNFVAGDIVLAKLGDPIGKTCIIQDILNHGIVVADVVRIRPTKDLNKEFLVRILNSKFIEYQLTHDIIGTTRPRVNLNQVRNLQLFLPSKDEQDRIADKLSKLDFYVDSEKQKLSKLKHIKAGLMQDLLTGKVRVNHLIEQEAVA